MNDLMKDWKKRAAATLTDEETELAFMRQAFIFIESKAKPLVQEPYFIGFEIVQKNDANTNIVGLFVFRIEGNLLYAPVFYKNGEIKGVNLLYSTKERLFNPLTPEWCNYHIGKLETHSGGLIDDTSIRQHTRGINFSDLVRPESLSKKASETTVKAWEDMCKRAEEHYKEASDTGVKHLTRFLKEAGVDGMKVLQGAVEHSLSFAEKINDFYTPEEWLDVELPVLKEAAITEPESLILHDGRFNPNAKVPTQEQFGMGYSLEDTRKETAEIYKEMESYGEAIRESGVYKVMSAEGDWLELIVIKSTNPRDAAVEHYYDGPKKMPASSNTLEEAGWNLSNDNCRHKFYFIDPESGEYCSESTKEDIYGQLVRDIGEGDTVEFSKLRKGNSYLFVAENGSTFTLHNIDTVNRDDNIQTITEQSPYNCGLILNTELKSSDLDLKVLGKDTKVFKLKTEVDSEGYLKNYTGGLDFKPGNLKTLHDFLCGNTIKKASVQKLDNGRFIIDVEGCRTFELSKVATAVALANKLGVHGNAAMDIVKEASGLGKFNFLIKASRITLENLPMLDRTTNNPDFGVVEDQAVSQVISTSSDGPKAKDNRVGDKYNPHGITMIIEQGTPEQIYEMSQTTKDPELFDLGVVGSLVSAFDASGVVESFLPDIRKGLDKLCRLLFLVYWKPEDFVEAYGSGDLMDLENKLNSTSKQYGELVLTLMQQFKFEDTLGTMGAMD